jgi:hypothetical protein
MFFLMLDFGLSAGSARVPLPMAARQIRRVRKAASRKTSFDYFAPQIKKLPENSTKLYYLCTNIHNSTF